MQQAPYTSITDSIQSLLQLFVSARGMVFAMAIVVGVAAISPAVLAIVLFCILTWLVYRHLELGIYILVALAPMTGLVITGEWLAQVSGGIVQMPGFIALAVDVWAAYMVGLYGIQMIERWLTNRRETIVLPGIWLYGLFLLASVASLLHLSQVEISEGLKYMIRFPLFVYIGYVVLGVNTITSKRILAQCFRIYVWVGVGAAMLGLLSLVLNISGVTGLYRAVPIGIFGIDLFNYAGDIRFGHILLAEHLTTVLPIAMYLAYHTMQTKKTYVYVSVFLLVMCALTFSRAGWVTLFFQMIVFGVLLYKYIPWQKLKRHILVAAVIFFLVGGYMFSTLSSPVVASSNSARITLTEIGWYFFKERPLFGQGIGRYEVLLEDVFFFTYQFGDPIDAHSILTKISTEQGLAGLGTFGLFVGWLIFAVYTRMKHERFTKDARVAAFLSFFLIVTPLFFQLFNTQYYAARMWVPIMFALSLIFLYREDTSKVSAYISFLPRAPRHIVSNIFKS